MRLSERWNHLAEQQRKLAQVRISQLFAQDRERFPRFSATLDEMLVDFSKNLIDPGTLDHLIALATERGLLERIEQMFAAEPVNWTEERPSLHIALRDSNLSQLKLKARELCDGVQHERQRMFAFAEQVRAGQMLGSTGEPITDVINIGVGGSDLGGVMATKALCDYADSPVRVGFVSSIDGMHVKSVLERVHPATTLFIISSKSFTTVDTLANAETVKRWFIEQGGCRDCWPQHFAGISMNAEAMDDFGIPKSRQFYLWDWVGGRFSLSSSIGLPVAIAIGPERFEQMLSGFRLMDEHFYSTPLHRNIPVLMGLLAVWYINFWHTSAHVILPYDQRLHRLPAYLTQLDMESLGKRIDRDGCEVDYQTGSVIMGEVGSNAQHSFYQLLHQGTRLVSSDFIAVVANKTCLNHPHELALANCLAQSRALMEGKCEAQVREELLAKGLSDDEIKRLLPYKVHPGNRPSTTILLEKLTPKTLGMLIALYEHKVFVQSVIWDINPFDQWGVEYGKEVARHLFRDIGKPSKIYDGSTNGLLSRIALCLAARGDSGSRPNSQVS